MYLVVFTKQAAKDAKKLKAAGLDKKAKALIDIIAQDPLATPPTYEALVGNLAGFYSRRINIQRRLVYTIDTKELNREGVTYTGVVKVVRM
jgi:Txe/YoeB family toxin of toxin-antitoxin system